MRNNMVTTGQKLEHGQELRGLKLRELRRIQISNPILYVKIPIPNPSIYRSYFIPDFKKNQREVLKQI